MQHSIREVMTPNPTVVESRVTCVDAAHVMRERGIGSVVVVDNGHPCGILTDRDIVVRGLTRGRDPVRTRVGDICSRRVTTISPEESVGEAVRLMRQRAIRRLPVEEDGQVVGMVTIGDLAIDTDRRSALADISAAPPNT